MLPGKTIKKVEKVEIRGLSIPNSINLERKEMDVNSEDIRDEVMNEQYLYFAEFFFARPEIAEESKSVTIKAVFEIGE